MLMPLGAKSHVTNSTQVLCGLCEENISKYSCPRCSILYCSLTCYKSEKHSNCSERFYETNVKETLVPNKRLQHTVEEARDSRKLVRILNKFDNDDADWKYEIPDNIKERKQEVENTLRPGYLEDEDNRPLTVEEEHELQALVEEADVDKLLGLLNPAQKRDFERMLSNYEVDDE